MRVQIPEIVIVNRTNNPLLQNIHTVQEYKALRVANYYPVIFMEEKLYPKDDQEFNYVLYPKRIIKSLGL
jgi:hypothetical protein